ncbi:MAG: penicillin-binding protein 1C [Pseudomonadota bacterium]
MRRRRAFAVLCALAVAAPIAAGAAAAGAGWLALTIADQFAPVDAPLPPVSPVVLDRHGALLRAFTVDGGRWRLPVTLDAVDPRFVELLIAYEDQRFRTHAGVDPRALVRAGWQAVRHRRIVSGASTLTMQTARLMSGARRKTASRKLGEMVQALRLERSHSKDEILTRYLHLAPYGGNIEGLRAASLAYFGREPKRLTLAQSALLIALPQSPERRRPDRHFDAAKKARDRVLDRLLARGAVTAAESARAKREAVPKRRRPVPRLAPHLARRLIAQNTGADVVKTALDRDWQAALETLAASHVDRVAPKVSAAIVVADLSTGEMRASVGAAKFLDARRAGHVDMTTALRSPGSTLKPFVYGLAIEAGLVARNTLIEDAPRRFKGYEPKNFDEDFRGMVSVEMALRQSLNVPAVMLLDALGPIRLAVRLEAAGATVALPSGYTPTLALGLGGFGTRLTDLAGLYAGLANRGQPVTLSPMERAPLPPRLLAPRAARSVSAMLQGMRPPRNASPGEIAYKTGTSYGHRDAWAIGYDNRHVVAVWIGRPDGTPVPHLTGWTDAAPLLFDAFARIGVTRRAPAPVATPTADLPPPLRTFEPARRTRTGAARGDIEIAFPPEGAVVAAPGGALVARVVGRAADAWLLNGRPLKVKSNRRRAEMTVQPGAHTLTVITADGTSTRVAFTVE